MATSKIEDRSSDPTDPYSRGAQTFPELTPDQIERAKPFGTIESLAQGTQVFTRGERSVDFFILLDGAIDIIDHQHHGEAVITTHGPRQFTGEIDLFSDRKILVSGRMAEDGRVIRIDRVHFRKLLAAEPDIGDVVMRAFILRRVGLINHEQASVTLLTEPQSPDGLRIERFLKRNGHPVQVLYRDRHESARQLMDQHNVADDELPALVCAGGRPLRRPSNADVAECLGLSEAIDPETEYHVVIVGAGPSGLAAAVYAASEGLSTLVLESEAPGGQAGTSSKIENFLGFPTGVSGQELAGRAQVQAQKFGAKIVIPRQVSGIDCDTWPYHVVLECGTRIRAQSIVIASGARYRGLNLPDCSRFDGLGLHYAATYIESELCVDEEVIVVGGGNSAGQAAVFLSRHAKHVHMLVRGETLSDTMSDYLIGRIQASNRITLRTCTEITGLEGERHLDRVTWTCRRSGESETREIRRVFLMIGAVPNTDWLRGCVDLDDRGFVCVGGRLGPLNGFPLDRTAHLFETSQPGVFAVGDVRSNSVKRVASAVGEGSIAVQFIHRVLSEFRSERI
jgi:thioredoxin reductase (NADPH)